MKTIIVILATVVLAGILSMALLGTGDGSLRNTASSAFSSAVEAVEAVDWDASSLD